MVPVSGTAWQKVWGVRERREASDAYTLRVIFLMQYFKRVCLLNLTAPRVLHGKGCKRASALICTFYTRGQSAHGTGILFVIRGDTFNKVWKCILWNIHIWRSVAGCHGYACHVWFSARLRCRCNIARNTDSYCISCAHDIECKNAAARIC